MTKWAGIEWASRHATHRDWVAVGGRVPSAVAAMPPHDPAAKRRIPRQCFVGVDAGGRPIEPRVGRFYPRRCLDPVSTPGSFRVLGIDAGTLTINADPAPAGVEARRIEGPLAAPGGSTLAVAGDPVTRLLRAGIGFQAEMAEGETDFFAADGLRRSDERPDPAFYITPRLLHHVDATAQAILAEMHRVALAEVSPGAPVLDLMSGWATHLPADSPWPLTGLGLNAVELAANPRLSNWLIADLNARPGLPFADATFGGVLCALSVEYLIDPVTVFGEVARVLRPGAPFVVSWSERWFPPKAIRLWSELHPYERVGFVIAALRRAGFTAIESESRRGLKRPAGDRYADRLAESDPLYRVVAVRGRDNATNESRRDTG